MHKVDNSLSVKIVISTDLKRCNCCNDELPLEYFNKSNKGYNKICMQCERKKKGRYKDLLNYNSKKLLEELYIRGYRGTLNYITKADFSFE